MKNREMTRKKSIMIYIDIHYSNTDNIKHQSERKVYHTEGNRKKIELYIEMDIMRGIER